MLGMVVFTGKETRMEMNNRTPRQKTGKVDGEINWLTKVLFLQMMLLALCIILSDGL
jgi:phospholipid-translocating ATPase